ncbi:arylsulfatase [Bacteroides thetaiotaomicron]|jgi:arylsulfatase A-like enzyme|uniref:sulfatase-like hydrolase/transferase n=1 Tax=Bacteroides TaxID=816 RepID=UPI000ED395A8|nr:sulfatase-like hydrolase/transferase [Bacteroides thetaiotaomicron]RGP00674.1 arylsulfatase [Bacteroides thetaiotaomicron]
MKNSYLLLPAICFVRCASETAEKPNVIVILADDLGFGDVSAYGSATIHTPHIDKLANEGVCFTNGYATSATSTPSRYALMTGMYPWKNKDAKILPGDAPLIIDEHQFTLPKMMQSAGYTTGAIGKWHLGMGNGNVNWNEVVKPGAKEIGFDYSCLIAATNDRVPTVYVEDGKVVGLDPDDPIEVSYEKNFEGEPTALSNPELLKMEWAHGHNNSIVNGIPRIGYMKGGKAARWVDEDMADYFVGKVKDFVSGHKDEPFFLYYGLHQPHVPRAPHSRFAGTTTMGPRGDAIIEADWCVGELIAHLEKEGLLENTMIIFSSDNGPVLNDGYKDGAAEKVGEHKPAGGLRGGKYSLFDGGTHIPLFVYWKGTISPVISDALICQMDLIASLGKLVDASLPEGLDSREYLDAFMGKKLQARENLVVEAQGRMAYRQGDWMMIPPYRGQERNLTGNELGNLPEYALFNLKEDKAQQENRVAGNEPLLEEMKENFFTLTAGYYKSEVEEEPLK